MTRAAKTLDAVDLAVGRGDRRRVTRERSEERLHARCSTLAHANASAATTTTAPATRIHFTPAVQHTELGEAYFASRLRKSCRSCRSQTASSIGIARNIVERAAEDQDLKEHGESLGGNVVAQPTLLLSAP